MHFVPKKKRILNAQFPTKYFYLWLLNLYLKSTYIIINLL